MLSEQALRCVDQCSTSALCALERLEHVCIAELSKYSVADLGREYLVEWQSLEHLWD
jgi:hypothetical protein